MSRFSNLKPTASSSCCSAPTYLHLRYEDGVKCCDSVKEHKTGDRPIVKPAVNPPSPCSK